MNDAYDAAVQRIVLAAKLFQDGLGVEKNLSLTTASELYLALATGDNEPDGVYDDEPTELAPPCEPEEPEGSDDPTDPNYDPDFWKKR